MTLLITQGLHWGLALIPVLIMLTIFVWLDAFKLMSLKEVLVLLLLGGLGALAAYPVSGKMLDTLPIGFSLYSRFIAPWIEEAIKALIMIILFRINRIGYKLDAIISGFAIGAGFSVVENILYLTLFPNTEPAPGWCADSAPRSCMEPRSRYSPQSRTSSPSARTARPPPIIISACCGSFPAMASRSHCTRRSISSRIAQ